MGAPAPGASAAPTPTASGDVGDEVTRAFALGWQLSELSRGAHPRAAAKGEPRGGPPGVASLSDSQQTTLGIEQVQAALTVLAPTIADAGLQVPDVGSLREVFEKGDSADEVRAAVFELHVTVLAALTAADFRLGKAYGLGRALAETCRAPESLESFRKTFAREPIANLKEWLADLQSVLPPHASRAVYFSLGRWEAWAGTLTSEGDWQQRPENLSELLARQAKLWRALLSGEKLGQDMLRIEEYVAAAQGLLKQGWRLSKLFLRRYLLVVVLVLVLFVGGLTLLLTVHTTGRVAAGVGALAAALGISWKGIGAAMSELSRRVATPLWGAELDHSIAAAITLAPGFDPDRARTLFEETPARGPSVSARAGRRR